MHGGEGVLHCPRWITVCWASSSPQRSQRAPAWDPLQSQPSWWSYQVCWYRWLWRCCPNTQPRRKWRWQQQTGRRLSNKPKQHSFAFLLHHVVNLARWGLPQAWWGSSQRVDDLKQKTLNETELHLYGTDWYGNKKRRRLLGLQSLSAQKCCWFQLLETLKIKMKKKNQFATSTLITFFKPLSHIWFGSNAMLQCWACT